MRTCYYVAFGVYKTVNGAELISERERARFSLSSSCAVFVCIVKCRFRALVRRTSNIALRKNFHGTKKANVMLTDEKIKNSSKGGRRRQKNKRNARELAV